MAVIKIVPMPGAVGDKGDEGAPGPQGPQGPAGQNGLPGTPALWSYQGAWNSSAAYAVGDVVVYQGQLYYTKSVTTAGTLPTVTAKFDLIASKGADGTNGTNGTNGAPGAGFGIFYLGNYNPSSGYVPDIAVVRGSDGQLYLAKASGQLGDPVGNTAQWEVWIPKGQDGAPGTNGADALWNYTGEYNGGASYAVGDIATYDGQLWYRVGANGGNVGDIPSPGFWNLLAAKGEPGTDVFAEDGTLYGPTNFGGLKVLGLLNSGDNDLALEANDADIHLQASSGAVTIAAPEVTITSNAVPSSVNINTYSGAIINSARTSGYSDADKVVATLGDLTTPTSGSWGHDFFQESGLVTETYDTVADYYKIGELVYFDLNVNLGYVTDWGQTQVDPPLWHSWSFKLPYNARGVTGIHNVVFTGMIYDTSLAEEVSERTSNDQGSNPIFGKIVDVGGESRVYLYSIVNSEFANYATGELRNVTSTYPKDFTQPANIQTGLNASRLRISGTYRSA
jgi:hypothetical protein